MHAMRHINKPITLPTKKTVRQLAAVVQQWNVASINQSITTCIFYYCATNIAEEDVSERDVTIGNSQLQQPQEM